MRSFSLMSVKRRRTLQAVARQALVGAGLLALMPAVPVRAADFNFDYSVSGASALLPVQVFDDGSRTYLQFASPTGMPHVAIVASDGQVVPFRVMPPYLVVNSLLSRFTLREGNQTAEIASNRLPALASGASFFAAPEKKSAAPLKTDADAAPVTPEALAAAHVVARGASAGATTDATPMTGVKRPAKAAVRMAAAAKSPRPASSESAAGADEAPLISVMTAAGSGQPLAGDPVAAAPLPEAPAMPATPLLAIDSTAARRSTAAAAAQPAAMPAAPASVNTDNPARSSTEDAVAAAAPETVAEAAPAANPEGTDAAAPAVAPGPWQLTPGTLRAAFEALCQRYGYTLSWQVDEDKQHYVFDYPVTLPGGSFLKDVQAMDKMVNYERHRFDLDVYEANKVLSVKGDEE